MEKKVTQDMIIADIITKYPLAIDALMECGMGCITCPASQGESLAEASQVHGLDPEDVEAYVNRYLELVQQ